MRKLGILLIFSVVFATPAFADCKYGYQTLGGSVVNEEDRGFTLSPGATIISVTTDNTNKKLSFVVKRPSGGTACSDGPSNNLRCAIQVNSDNEGYYHVIVKNSSGSNISYQLSCSDG